MKGYTGKMLFVDLSRGLSRRARFQRTGSVISWGRGMACGCFMTWCIPSWMSGCTQPLIFANGPLSGTMAPCSGRCVVVFWSPATHTLARPTAAATLPRC